MIGSGDSADTVVIVGSLDEQRNNIVPNLGATSYGLTQNQIANQSQGSDAAFNQTLLRVPGFAQDSYGQLHVRGEHANLQFRINDVLIPEGIAGFGQEFDTRVVDSVQVITGSLPAQYGINTAGIIDIHTKSGAFNNGDEIGFYGGSYNTYRPSFEFTGTQGKFSYFFTGDFLANSIGIENPDSKDYPIHDHTEQYHGFGYIQYVIDNTSRLSLILSAYDADFQIPNNPGQAPAFGLAGVPIIPGSVTDTTPFGVSQFSSTHLNENQNEQNDYAVLAYQKSAGKLNFQQSLFIRNSSLLFRPTVRAISSSTASPAAMTATRSPAARNWTPATNSPTPTRCAAATCCSSSTPATAPGPTRSWSTTTACRPATYPPPSSSTRTRPATSTASTSRTNGRCSSR